MARILLLAVPAAVALSLPSIRVSGINEAERALIAEAVSTAAGSSFKLSEVKDDFRVAVFDDICPDEDAWLLNFIAEQLDGAEVDPPILLTAAPASYSIGEAREAHIERYGLRTPVEVRPTEWRPEYSSLVKHVAMDGALVEYNGRSWWDVSNVAVYDGVVDEDLRFALLSLLASDGWDVEAGADPALWERGSFNDVQESSDADVRANGFGLTPDALEELCAESPSPEPIVELQSRLAALLQAAQALPAASGRPSGDDTIQATVKLCRQSEAVFGGGITPLAANAPVATDGADAYSWHIDADPALFPPSPWTDCFGRYPNRAGGENAPRFVTALVYLSPEWREEWGAPTRFLDPPTGEVLEVTPRPGRIVIMDQDLTHSVTSPEAGAGARPRYSLVLKLALHARAAQISHPTAEVAPPLRDGPIARLASSEPTLFGAARVPVKAQSQTS